MKKKTIITTILILLMIPLSIQLFSGRYDCGDLPDRCGGNMYCYGDSLSNEGTCVFRCLTGDTYSEYRICWMYNPWDPIDDNPGTPLVL